MANAFSWHGVLGHLCYQHNLSGQNGLGTWEILDGRAPIPFLSQLQRDYGDSVSDTNDRLSYDHQFVSVGVAGISAEMYALLGRWDVGVDFKVSVEITLEALIRNAGASFLRYTRGQSRSLAQQIKGLVDQLVQIFPKFEVEGRIGISIGIAQNNRAYIRFATLASAGLSITMPSGSGLDPIDLGSTDGLGRSWQITLSNMRGHIPTVWQ